MLFHLLTAIYRNAKKNWLFHLINSVGLIAGFTVCFAIISYYVHETSYDSFHRNASHKHMLQVNYSANGSMVALPPPSILLEVLKKEAQVKNASRVYVVLEPLVSSNDSTRLIRANGLVRVDPDFFKLFNVEEVEGEKHSIFSNESNAIVTERFLKKLAPRENPIGLQFKIGDTHYVISSVIKDLPSNSSLNFEIVSATTTHDSLAWEDAVSPLIYFESYNSNNLTTITSGLNLELKNFFGDEAFSVKIIRMDKQYFESDLLPIKGDEKKINLFLVIGIITLIVSLTNYLNINAITLIRNAKSMGISRMLGATGSYFTSRYLLESFLVVAVLGTISYCVLLVTEGKIGELYHLPVGNNSIFEFRFFLLIFCTLFFAMITITVFLVIINSKNRPLDLTSTHNSSSSFGRKAVTIVVVFQFIVSSVLILYTLMVAGQHSFLDQRDLGFDKSRKIVIRFPGSNNEIIKGSVDKFRNELAGYPAITRTGFNSMPGFSSLMEIKTNDKDKKSLKLYVIEADENFISLMNLRLVRGRDFTPASKGFNEIIVNETAAKVLSAESGKDILGSAIPGIDNNSIVGITNDFSFSGFNKIVGPVIIKNNQQYFDKLFVSYTGASDQVVKIIKDQWKVNFPDQPLDYFYFDNEFDRLYLPDKTRSGFFLVSTIVAIIISSLGLFGLSFYIVNDRRKEVAIRKIHGASFLDISLSHMIRFILPVTVSFVISIPVFVFLANDFLEDYAYRIKLNFSFFISSLIIQIAITLLIVSYQTITSASVRPIKDLRLE